MSVFKQYVICLLGMVCFGALYIMTPDNQGGGMVQDLWMGGLGVFNGYLICLSFNTILTRSKPHDR